MAKRERKTKAQQLQEAEEKAARLRRELAVTERKQDRDEKFLLGALLKFKLLDDKDPRTAEFQKRFVHTFGPSYFSYADRQRMARFLPPEALEMTDKEKAERDARLAKRKVGGEAGDKNAASR